MQEIVFMNVIFYSKCSDIVHIFGFGTLQLLTQLTDNYMTSIIITYIKFPKNRTLDILLKMYTYICKAL